MQRINLNLVPSGVSPVVYTSRYDIGRQFELDLYDGEDEYNVPDGAIALISGVKPDRHSFAYGSEDDRTNIVINGSHITVSTTDQMTAEVGKIACSVSISKGDTLLINSLNFIISVEPVVTIEDTLTSASDLAAYQEMAERVTGSYDYFKRTNDHIDSVRENVETMQSDVHDYVDAFTESVNHIVSYTLEAAKWTGDAAPYKYDLSSITDFSNVIATVSMDPNVYTEEQMQAALDANIKGAEHDSFLYAMDTKPTIDIPVIIGWQEYKRAEGGAT